MYKLKLISIIFLILFYNYINITNCYSEPKKEYVTTSNTNQRSPFGFLPAVVIPPFEYGIDNPYDIATGLGIKWDRSLMFIWTLEQPDIKIPQYCWRNDKQIKDIPTGINVMGNILIGDPSRDEKYAVYAKSSNSFLPKNVVAYKNFVNALVERYDGDGIDDMPDLTVPIKHWQIDNEPPHGLSDYAEFLKISYISIKKADPSSTVIIGGVGGMPPIHEYINIFNKTYIPILDQLSKSKSRYFDIFDFHWYGNATGDYLGTKNIYHHIHQTLKERNLLPLNGFWITEMGTYSGEPLPLRILSYKNFPFQSEKQQAIDLIKRNIYPLTLGIKKVFMAFGLIEGFKYDNGYFDFTGLIYDGRYSHDLGKGVKKLSFYTYKKMIEILDGANWERIKCIQKNDSLYIYEFVKNNKSIWVAWNDKCTSQIGKISLNKHIKKVKITEAVPNFNSGINVNNYKDAFKNVKHYINNSEPRQIVFPISEIPIYIEEI